RRQPASTPSTPPSPSPASNAAHAAPLRTAPPPRRASWTLPRPAPAPPSGLTPPAAAAPPPTADRPSLAPLLPRHDADAPTAPPLNNAWSTLSALHPLRSPPTGRKRPLVSPSAPCRQPPPACQYTAAARSESRTASRPNRTHRRVHQPDQPR